MREKLEYSGEAQIIISQESGKDEVNLRLDHTFTISTEENIKKILLDNYNELDEVVTKEKGIEFKIQFVENVDLLRTSGSGKLVRVKDERSN